MQAIHLPKDLHRLAKVTATQRGMTIRTFIEVAVRLYLNAVGVEAPPVVERERRGPKTGSRMPPRKKTTTDPSPPPVYEPVPASVYTPDILASAMEPESVEDLEPVELEPPPPVMGFVR